LQNHTWRDDWEEEDHPLEESDPAEMKELEKTPQSAREWE
jgi:hypothetical protein